MWNIPNCIINFSPIHVIYLNLSICCPNFLVNVVSQIGNKEGNRSVVECGTALALRYCHRLNSTQCDNGPDPSSALYGHWSDTVIARPIMDGSSTIADGWLLERRSK